MTRVGLVVEGDAEYLGLRSLQSRLAGCPVLELANVGGFGESMTPAGVAKKAIKLVIAVQAKDPRTVVLCLDRERRSDAAADFGQQVRQALTSQLRAEGRRHDNLSVIVADRAFEAWILADAAGLHQRRHLKLNPAVGRFEGKLGAEQKLGKSELTRALGRNYSEKTDGPKLFKEIELEKARDTAAHATGSPSLDRLLRVLVGDDL